MNGPDARTTRLTRSRSRSSSSSRLDTTSFLLLQILVCILSASTLVTAQVAEVVEPTPGSGEASNCLSGVDQKEINRLFSEGGPTTRIQLCQSAEIHLTGPIIFSGKNQELSTHGYPDEDDKKAIIKLVGGRGGTAIQGDCRRCARVAIKNLIIDGNRAQLGRIREPGEAALDPPQYPPSSSSSSSSSTSSSGSGPVPGAGAGAASVMGQTSEELEDDGGDGDELDLDLEMREARARVEQSESQSQAQQPGVEASSVPQISTETGIGVQPRSAEQAQAPLLQEEDDGAEISGSTSPLILLGNNEGQVVSKCVVKDPRGWTAIQVREGDNLSCRNARISENQIGPAGEEWSESVDGEDSEEGAGGRSLASGLSLACLESVVTGNMFLDITDASMVIYGSPGSLIDDNTIRAQDHNAMGGILLSDYGPWEGNYTNTRVIGNTIEADEGTLIRIGIGIGASILSDDTETVFFGGVVKENILKGYGMGYGIAGAGLKDFVVVDNESKARHGGRLGDRCLVPLEEDDVLARGLTEEQRDTGVIRNPRPAAFLKNGKSIEGGQWQSDFVDSSFFYLVCLDPEVEGEAEPVRPKTKPVPAMVDDELEEDLAATIERLSARVKHDKKKTKVSIMERIISHSQTKMLEAIAALGTKVEVLVERAGIDKRLEGKARQMMGDEGVEILSSLAHLSARIATLETERTNTRETLDNFRRELMSLGKNLDRAKAHDTAVLLEISEILRPGKLGARSLVPPVFSNAMSTQKAVDWTLTLAYFFGANTVLGVVYYCWRWLVSKRPPGGVRRGERKFSRSSAPQ